MAILELQRKETSMAMMTTPRKKSMAALFSFNNYKPTSSSSFSNHVKNLPTPRSLTFCESMMEENIQNAEFMIISKWDPSKGSSYSSTFPNSITSSSSLFQVDRNEGKGFVKCVNDLRKAMHFLISEHSDSGSSSSKLVLAQNLMQIAMKRLENEFYQILSANKEHLNPSESISDNNSYSDDDDESAGSDVGSQSVLAMSDLRIIADCMVMSGYGRECMKIYKVARVSIVEETLYNLGIERYSASQINKLNPQALNHQIRNWLQAVKIAVKTLFHGERLLCDHVFAISETIRESCFTEISKDGGAVNLFKFPELVANGRRWPEKAFLLMELYETIKDLQPQVESIFSFEAVSCIKLQVLSSLKKLGESVQTILTEFELSIQKNQSRIAVPGGAIHPLTNSVMNYVSMLGSYSGVLSDIIIAPDSASPTQMPFPESYFESPHPHERQTSAISARIAWILLVLLCKLDRKAEIYNDIALSYLFLANNLHFVLEKVRTTALKFLLGDDWLAKLDRKVKLYAVSYESMAWQKVLYCLSETSKTDISPDMVKTYFRQISTAFEEACEKQRSWVVPDAKLRDEIKVSIARKLVPAYREFYDTNFTILSGERNLEALVRFSPDNLENHLSDLFHGNDVSGDLSTPNSKPPWCLPYVVKCD